MNQDFHPIEYLSLFLRWKYDQAVEKNEKVEFKEFKNSKRKRFLDSVVGSVALGIIALVIAGLILFVRNLIS